MGAGYKLSQKEEEEILTFPPSKKKVGIPTNPESCHLAAFSLFRMESALVSRGFHLLSLSESAQDLLGPLVVTQVAVSVVSNMFALFLGKLQKREPPRSVPDQLPAALY